MDATTKNKPSIRPLYAWEIREARRVFANRLQYERVRLHEHTGWPDSINRIGLRLKRMPQVDTHNAITLGNHIYFPVKLLEWLVPSDHPEHYKICWLIHELTHVWQYQHLGWGYLPMALNAQLRLGDKAYDFGGEAGLIAHRGQGWRLADFNLEQQGDIASTYYRQLSSGKDTSAWDPFIAEMQKTAIG